MVPVIEIGKRYLWKSCPIELLCEYCGVNLGNSFGDSTIEVIVLKPTSDNSAHCTKCHNDWNGSREGWFTVMAIENGEFGSVPYTQLHRIEGEVYDTA